MYLSFGSAAHMAGSCRRKHTGGRTVRSPDARGASNPSHWHIFSTTKEVIGPVRVSGFHKEYFSSDASWLREQFPRRLHADKHGSGRLFQNQQIFSHVVVYFSLSLSLSILKCYTNSFEETNQAYSSSYFLFFYLPPPPTPYSYKCFFFSVHVPHTIKTQ